MDEKVAALLLQRADQPAQMPGLVMGDDEIGELAGRGAWLRRACPVDGNGVRSWRWIANAESPARHESRGAATDQRPPQRQILEVAMRVREDGVQRRAADGDRPHIQQMAGPQPSQGAQ